MSEYEIDVSLFKAPSEIIGAEALAKLKAEGWQVVMPYQKIVVEGEGADEEYRLVPISQITTLEAVIRKLKGE